MIVAAPTPEEGRQGASSRGIGGGVGEGNRGMDGSGLAPGYPGPCSPTSIAAAAGRTGSLPAPSGSPGGRARRSVRPGERVRAARALENLPQTAAALHPGDALARYLGYVKIQHFLHHGKGGTSDGLENRLGHSACGMLGRFV